MSVTIQMSGNYPSISSGRIFFENTVTGAKVHIRIPRDVEKNTYGIRDITMDPGASSTILPENFAKKIDIQRPPKGAEEYWIFSGVGGSSVGFRSRVPIRIGIEDNNDKLEVLIFPFCLIRYAPSITSEGKELSQLEYQPHTEDVLRFVSPPFQYQGDYIVEISSPDEEFSLWNRRLKLEVDIGMDMDYILIGRDWQKSFQLIFEAQRIIIQASSGEHSRGI